MNTIHFKAQKWPVWSASWRNFSARLLPFILSPTVFLNTVQSNFFEVGKTSSRLFFAWRICIFANHLRATSQRDKTLSLFVLPDNLLVHHITNIFVSTSSLFRLVTLHVVSIFFRVLAKEEMGTFYKLQSSFWTQTGSLWVKTTSSLTESITRVTTLDTISKLAPDYMKGSVIFLYLFFCIINPKGWSIHASLGPYLKYYWEGALLVFTDRLTAVYFWHWKVIFPVNLNK